MKARGLRFWDLSSGQETRRLAWPADQGVLRRCLAVTADGKTAALDVQGGAVVLIDVARGKTVHRLPRHHPFLHGAAFTPDGRTVVVWGGDNKIRLWDVTRGGSRGEFVFNDSVRVGPVLVVGGGSGVAFTGAVAPDGRSIALGSQDRFIALHELRTGRLLRKIEKLSDGCGALAFSADGRALAWGGDHDGTVHLVERATGRERLLLRGHLGAVRCLAFAGGDRLISGSYDTTALVWNLTGRPPDDASPADLDAAWADLAGADAARAYRAIRLFAAAPRRAVPFLKARLRPALPAVEPDRLVRLLEDLDSKRFAVRGRAMAELEKLGESAGPALEKALEGAASEEKRRRLEQLLARLVDLERREPPPERLRQLRVVEALELAAAPEARQLLESLASGSPQAWLTREASASVARLARSTRPGR